MSNEAEPKSKTDPSQRIKELEEEVRRLRAGYRLGGGLLGLIVFGWNLPRAVQRWLEVAGPENPIPPAETGEVVGAMVQRLIRMGSVGLFLALLPSFLIWRQNLYIREQTRIATGELRAEFEKREELTIGNERSKHLRVIFDTKDCQLTTRERRCPPRAPLRLREEAVLRIDNLGWTAGILRGADLRNANLRGFEFNRPDFSGANLEGADLSEANLTGANFTDANLRDANLGGAQLLKADLSRADLTGADLMRANMFGAYLANALNLQQEQLNRTCGNHSTQVPEDLAQPHHWKTSNISSKCALPTG